MKSRFFVCVLAVGSLFAAQAFGHMVLRPFRAESGARHIIMSVTAPSEGEFPCVEYRIEIPPEWKEAGGLVDRVQVDPVWKATVETDEDGWIKSITWSGGETPKHHFVKFDLIVTLPKLTGIQQIKCWQTYSDGSVVAFVEDIHQEGVLNPASRLTLTAAGGGEEGEEGEEEGTSLVYYFGLSGLLGGLVGAALVLIVYKRKNA